MPRASSKVVGPSKIVLRFAILALLFVAPVEAQVLQAQVGASTLLNAEGGSLTFFTPGTVETVGVGMSQGHLVAGASTAFNFHSWEVIAGDRLSMLTTGETGTGVALRGLTIEKHTDDQAITLFTGLTGRAYSTGFFNGTQAKHFGTGGSFQRRLPHYFRVGMVGAVAGNLHTALEEVSWDHRGFKLSQNYGLIDSRRYSNASGRYQGAHFGAQVSRTTYLFNEERSTVTSQGVGASVWHVNGYASAFQSGMFSGQAIGGGLNFARLGVGVGETFSRQGPMFLGSVTERLTNRIFTSQYFSHDARGNTSTNFGGEYRTNFLTASIGYQQVFTPFGTQAFSKVLVAGLRLQFTHGETIDLSSAGTKWTAAGGTYIQTGIAIGNTPSRGVSGKYIVRGRVLDQDGSPIEGAAVMVGREELFTNAAGQWMTRTKNAKTVVLGVVLKDFLSPGEFAVARCPVEASPSKDETEIMITVERR